MRLMNTKVVHHTYPGTMSATELASLQPMQQLKKASFCIKNRAFNHLVIGKKRFILYYFCNVYIHVGYVKSYSLIVFPSHGVHPPLS